MPKALILWCENELSYWQRVAMHKLSYSTRDIALHRWLHFKKTMILDMHTSLSWDRKVQASTRKEVDFQDLTQLAWKLKGYSQSFQRKFANIAAGVFLSRVPWLYDAKAGKLRKWRNIKGLLLDRTEVWLTRFPIF